MISRKQIMIVLILLGLLTVTIPPALADPDSDMPCGNYTLPADNASVNPGNPMYGLKIALENIDESFTYNESDRLQKEINHTNLRLEDLELALASNDTEQINRTLNLYQMKFNQTENSFEYQARNGTVNYFGQNNTPKNPESTGLMNAWEMLYRHQITLQNLAQNHPENSGLAQAYNNSIESRYRFEEKIRERTVAVSGNDKGNKNSAINTTNETSQGKGNGSLNPSVNKTTGTSSQLKQNPDNKPVQTTGSGQAGNAVRNTSGKNDQNSNNQGNQISTADTTRGNQDGKTKNNGNSRQSGQ